MRHVSDINAGTRSKAAMTSMARSFESKMPSNAWQARLLRTPCKVTSPQA